MFEIILNIYISNVSKGDKKTTPKRRRSLATCEGSPSPGCTGVTPKTPGGTPRFMVPLSERQQLALLMQMTAEESQQQTGGEYKIAGNKSCISFYFQKSFINKQL